MNDVVRAVGYALKILQKYEESYPQLCQQNLLHKKVNLRENYLKYVVKVNNTDQNHYISKKLHKYTLFVLEAVKKLNIQDIQTAISSIINVTPEYESVKELFLDDSDFVVEEQSKAITSNPVKMDFSELLNFMQMSIEESERYLE